MGQSKADVLYSPGSHPKTTGILSRAVCHILPKSGTKAAEVEVDGCFKLLFITSFCCQHHVPRTSFMWHLPPPAEHVPHHGGSGLAAVAPLQVRAWDRLQGAQC